VNGEPVTTSRVLVEDDELAIGIYRARFSDLEDTVLRQRTETAPQPAALHEELLESTEAVVAASRAELRFVRGPHEGRTVRLTQARTSIGGLGSTVEIDGQLPRGSVIVRLVRGRPLVEPGQAAAYLAGARVREVTPCFAGEEVRVGEHGFVVDLTTGEEEPRPHESFGEMVGRSAPMRRLFGVLHRIAVHDAPVLLTGDSGTGKELAARGLHASGPRGDGPFVAVNCASITETLFESELFGHEKGAFTGAVGRRDGAFHHADGGTLFLDEIGETKPDLQAKLLRALESGEVRRVGAAVPEFPDVRVVAATNRNLQQGVREGTFRHDLYFRLAVLTVRLPSLRERRDDIPVLAQALLARDHPTARLTMDAQRTLQVYDWPGNVRELRNVLTRAWVLTGDVIDAAHLEFNPWAFEDESATPAPVPRTALPRRDPPERSAIAQALADAGGNRTQAARLLGIPRSSLLYKMNRFGIT
jgi:transcriptional regulator with GAF, ATPase, and Fis domain